MLIPLGVILLLYLLGVRNAWRRAGVGHGISARSVLCFLGAVLALVLALVSPLDALSGALFSAHMVQHLILILAAAPLLAASDFPLALLWALPRRWSRALGWRWNHSHRLMLAWRGLSSPVSAWLWFAIPLWVWHTRALYEAALRSEAIHAVEHLIFLLTAMLFWWVLLKPVGRRTGTARLRYGMAVPYLFTTALHSGVLGALMTFTTQPWYPYYQPLVAPWGLTLMEDQQLAGIIMWVPGGAVFALLTIGYFAAWFQAMDQQRDSLRSQ